MFSFDRNTSKVITKLTSIYPKLALVQDAYTGSTIENNSYVCLGTLKINNDNNSSYSF